MSRVSRYTVPGAPGTMAAPAGGAGVFGRLCRGCFNLAAATLIAVPLIAETPVPLTLQLPVSGLPVTLFDEIDEVPTYRFRYLVPALATGEIDYEAMASDMEGLCQSDALPRLMTAGAVPERIIVTLMAEPVEFGVMTPEIPQFFESYLVQDGLCIWEAF